MVDPRRRPGAVAPTRKESRFERQITARRARQDAKRQLHRSGDADAIERRRRTQGWRTW
jgi:hypothetical protein